MTCILNIVRSFLIDLTHHSEKGPGKGCSNKENSCRKLDIEFWIK